MSVIKLQTGPHELTSFPRDNFSYVTTSWTLMKGADDKLQRTLFVRVNLKDGGLLCIVDSAFDLPNEQYATKALKVLAGLGLACPDAMVGEQPEPSTEDGSVAWPAHITGNSYQHFKGGTYIAGGYATDATNAGDGRLMVLYWAAGSAMPVYARAASEFFGEVTPGVPRFKRIG